jgi:hypothetical protein
MTPEGFLLRDPPRPSSMVRSMSSRPARLPGLQDSCCWPASSNLGISMGILATDHRARNLIPQHPHHLSEESSILLCGSRARKGVQR